MQFDAHQDRRGKCNYVQRFPACKKMCKTESSQYMGKHGLCTVPRVILQGVRSRVCVMECVVMSLPSILLPRERDKKNSRNYPAVVEREESIFQQVLAFGKKEACCWSWKMFPFFSPRFSRPGFCGVSLSSVISLLLLHETLHLTPLRTEGAEFNKKHVGNVKF